VSINVLYIVVERIIVTNQQIHALHVQRGMMPTTKTVKPRTVIVKFVVPVEHICQHHMHRPVLMLVTDIMRQQQRLRTV
jgi:hypothetical protein